jgi:hypothetical protein
VGRPEERGRRDGDVPRAAGAIAVPAARIQLVTVLRPRARRAPTNCQASLGADLRSRNAARCENHWHGRASWCEDVMAGSVRCWLAGHITAIVPDAPAFVYPSRSSDP